jgi:hypothetical protein
MFILQAAQASLMACRSVHRLLQVFPVFTFSLCPRMRPDVIELCQRMVQSCRRVPLPAAAASLFADSVAVQRSMCFSSRFDDARGSIMLHLPSLRAHAHLIPTRLRLPSIIGALFQSTSANPHRSCCFDLLVYICGCFRCGMEYTHF